MTALTGHPAAGQAAADPVRIRLLTRYQAVRSWSIYLTETLSAEDMLAQSMEDASPTKWHLAHTTWFWEAMVLVPHQRDYRVFDDRFNFLFNSYYNALGDRHARPHRGLLTRPPLSTVLAYRQAVDAAMADFLGTCADDLLEATGDLIALGLAHEQQHQELILTDILHAFSCNSLYPAFRPRVPAPAATVDLAYASVPGGVCQIGHGGDRTGTAAAALDRFAFDHEGPRHQVYVQPFRLANRPVTNGEVLEFVLDGGYRDSRHWLSDGWATVRAEGWAKPAYWLERDGAWFQMGLNGLVPLEANAPATQLSYYEADAYARWAGKRLPTEAEWERTVEHFGLSPDHPAANTAGRQQWRPVPAQRPADWAADTPLQMFGDVWEWTASPFTAYPGFKPDAGAVGEYNGKFMSNQFVLRGGSCATPDGHLRASYRNFFYPHQRWQFSGLRLAEDTAEGGGA